ncbi:MAG: heavy-metal-associated domain-containing protein [Proteobacteria bacterium]|nr:heavy-metal-associated domain-containing protein [Pseudomonadota bacterium]MBU4277082.1 heavy-metal-associated domain-containing protein [Pseudomonadota bacterium]MBU4383515.1 heavy-metal-associated domain-containing protein [Pseudomonadota bacterium]MCG2764440.1 heavy-metal-associated domain-containing protein [Desulfarculaceae bacterium]
METKTVNIPDISCGHCLAAVKREAGEVKGVKSVEGDVATKQVTIKWDAPATWDQIAVALKDAGYPAK